MGGGVTDPDMNPRLRLAVQNAKGQSMPKDNIQRAINKGTGAGGEDYQEMRYEGYGPGGVAVIVEALTDNLNRSASNIRAAFSKNGGSLGETGSVSFMFDRVGEIVYKPEAGDADTVMEAAIEAGAEDVETGEDGHTITCAFEDLGAVSKRWKRRWARPNPSMQSGSRRTRRPSTRTRRAPFSSCSTRSTRMMTSRTSIRTRTSRTM